MSKLLFFSWILLAIAPSYSSFAEVIQYKPLRMDVREGDGLFIQGFAGKVRFEPSADSHSLSIFLKQVNSDKLSSKMESLQEEWMFVMDRKEHWIRLTITGPASRKGWAPMVRQKVMPRFELVIKGPSMPLKLSWWTGKIELKKWHSTAEISLLNGRVVVEGMEGDLRLFGQKGSIQVTNHKGSAVIGSYSSKIVLGNIIGDVEVENFAGESRLHKINGTVRFKGFKGALRLNDSEGDLNFDSRQANISLSKFKGVVKGRSAQGRVALDLSGKVNVDVRSQEGEVSLKLRSSGASVNLGSREGAIYAPSYLRSTRYPTLKVRQGRLRGREQGRVFVRTESGMIRLR